MTELIRTPAAKRLSLLEQLNGQWHQRALWIYTVIVFAHWLEHLFQAHQVFVLGWARPAAGGLLGLWFPALASSEVLHFLYNLSVLAGLALLRPAFRGRARLLWSIALGIQGWHFFEHVLLQGQLLTGTFLFGATEQTSILQFWIPRVELHLLYNSIVFLPTALGLYLHFYPSELERREVSCGCRYGSGIKL